MKIPYPQKEEPFNYNEEYNNSGLIENNYLVVENEEDILIDESFRTPYIYY